MTLSIYLGIDVLSFLYGIPDLGSSFWGMVLIIASTNVLTAKIAAGCFAFALLVVLFVAKNVSIYESQGCIILWCQIVPTDAGVHELELLLKCNYYFQFS